MVVNLYVDHMMSTPPQTPEEVWNATRQHSKLYTDAARRIGLSNSEYREFQNALLDGKAIYVKLPHRIDVMAGNRHGSIYAVRHAVLPNNVAGWKVVLSSGAIVYVPQACGNLSLTRVKKVRPYVAAMHYAPPRLPPPRPPAPPPRETQVVFTPPPPIFEAPPPPVPPAVMPPPPPPAVAVVKRSFEFLLLPIVLVFHNNNHQVQICDLGSNAFGVCKQINKQH
jgi:hypothetical protein